MQTSQSDTLSPTADSEDESDGLRPGLETPQTIHITFAINSLSPITDDPSAVAKLAAKGRNGLDRARLAQKLGVILSSALPYRKRMMETIGAVLRATGDVDLDKEPGYSGPEGLIESRVEHLCEASLYAYMKGAARQGQIRDLRKRLVRGSRPSAESRGLQWLALRHLAVRRPAHPHAPRRSFLPMGSRLDKGCGS